jgi:hypothetical protein
MTIFRMHVERGEEPDSMFYGNALVFAEDERAAIQKFRELFGLDSSLSIRIQKLDLSGILVI